jgi:hypothetical protein
MVADDLLVQDFKGAKWLLLSGYCFYGKHLLQRAIELAAEAGIKVALDLASFEIVQSFKQELKGVLESGRVHCCFCNEVWAGLVCLWHAACLQLDTTAWLAALPYQAALPATQPVAWVEHLKAMHEPAWCFLVAFLQADRHDRICWKHLQEKPCDAMFGTTEISALSAAAVSNTRKQQQAS